MTEQKRLAESESWRGMIDKFVIAIMDELRCSKACGGIDGDQNDPDSTTQVVLQAIRDSWQAAIDAALESVKEYLESAIQYRIISGDLYMVGRNDAFRDAAGFIESRIGTNPLAERDARIAELESLLEEAYADADDVLRPRIAELERENEILKTIPMKYRRMGFNAVLQDKIEELERELAEARKDAEAWKEYAQHLEYCATCGESVHYCDIGTELRNAAMRQEAE